MSKTGRIKTTLTEILDATNVGCQRLHIIYIRLWRSDQRAVEHIISNVTLRINYNCSKTEQVYRSIRLHAIRTSTIQFARSILFKFGNRTRRQAWKTVTLIFVDVCLLSIQLFLILISFSPFGHGDHVNFITGKKWCRYRWNNSRCIIINTVKES